MSYVWTWGPKPIERALDRKGERCEVLARGGMNSALIEFSDGHRVVVSRNGLRRAPETAQNPSVRRFDQQLDLDGGLHDIGPQTAILRLFEPAPTQLAGQQSIEVDS